MKTVLIKGEARFEVERHGNQVFTREVHELGAETESHQTFFDEATAAAHADELLESRRVQGFTVSAETRRADAARRLAVERDADVRRRYRELAAAVDPQAALRRHLRPLATTVRAETAIESLIGRVAAIEAAGLGLELRLDNGSRLLGAEPQTGAPIADPGLARFLAIHRCLWVYNDNSDDHRLFAGSDAGPPEGDAELDGTPLAGAEVLWFAQEMPDDRYWLIHDGHIHRYEFDGGLGEIGDLAADVLLLERIAAAALKI